MRRIARVTQPCIGEGLVIFFVTGVVLANASLDVALHDINILYLLPLVNKEYIEKY